MKPYLKIVLPLITLFLVACGGGEAYDPNEVVVEITRIPEEEAAPEPATEVAEEVVVAQPANGNVMLPEVIPSDVAGDISVAGSSTVFPLSERMAERFTDEGYADIITIDSIGSGGGFERFCESGESDVANASRAIKDKEVEACRSIGREPIEFRVGTDALAVTVSAENDFLTDVSLEELALIFSTAEMWSDVRGVWPDEPIQRFTPGTDSGTFDYFVEEVFHEDQAPILSADNLQLSEDDNVLVQGITGSPYAIGYFGYAYYQENADILKTVRINGIEATGATVDDGSYPLGRPLYFYSTSSIMQEKPQVAAFVNYFLTYVNEEVIDVGYFPASDDALNTAKQGWATANPDAGVMAQAGGSSLPVVVPSDVVGDISVAGSSTVFPLSERMAERFTDEGYADIITIDSIGSGGGFERFCESGESDIVNASRAIKDTEVEACREINREPIEFRVGTDALAVTVSAENEFLTDVSMEELALIFSTAEMWSDVRGVWPDEPIQRFTPGTDSGTFDYFVEEVFHEDQAPILSADNLQLSEDDNVLVQGITGSPYAIGYFGYAYYQENADILKTVRINGIEATGATVDDGSYPLGRPLYFYSTSSIMQEKPQVAAFVNYFLTYVNDEVIDVGYFPASDAALQNAQQSWLDAQ